MVSTLGTDRHYSTPFETKKISGRSFALLRNAQDDGGLRGKIKVARHGLEP